MNSIRRNILKRISLCAALSFTAVTGVLRSGQAMAGLWNARGFRAEKVSEVVNDIGASNATESKDITIKAPEIAENGAVVPIEITSDIVGTESITIVTENNPNPLTAIFNFSNGAESYVSTRIKMGKSSLLKAYVKAGGKYYVASRDIKVTIGGCGG